MFTKRKIEDIFNVDTSETINANELLDKIIDQDDYVNLRRSIRQHNRLKDTLYKCDFCGEPLELSCYPNSEGNHTFYFRHLKDPGFDKCPVKTNSNLTKQEILRLQYAFKSESKLHIQLKEKVGSIISKYIDSDLVVDSKFIMDKIGEYERRRPDIYFKYLGREICIEFQVNNTFHSVIEERESFYERNKISLFWVFGKFNISGFQSITQKDIYVPNFNNAFLFDNEAESESNKRQTLCLHVFYKKYKIVDNNFNFDWFDEIITIDQLNFNTENNRPYYFNSPEDKLNVESELDKLIISKKQSDETYIINNNIDSLLISLTEFKKNDLLNYSNLYHSISLLDDNKKDLLNNRLGLKSYTNKNGQNLIEYLFSLNNSHTNLILFLLKSLNIDLKIETKDTSNSLFLMFIKSTNYFRWLYIKYLFARGYKLTEFDREYILKTYDIYEAQSIIMKYHYFEIVKSLELIEIVDNKLNELFVMESARYGEVRFLGNGKQGLVWLANLAAHSYTDSWLYIDIAFKRFNFYSKIHAKDKKKTFSNMQNELQNKEFVRDIKFEEVIDLIFPELYLKYSSIDKYRML